MKRWEEGERQETEPSAKRACLDDAVVLLDEDATDVDPTPAVDLSPSSPVPLDQHKDVHVIKGSIEDIIFIVYDEIKKDEIHDLYVVLQRKRIVWVRSSANISFQSLLDHLLVAYPDVSLVTPTFSANNSLIGLGKYT